MMILVLFSTPRFINEINSFIFVVVNNHLKISYVVPLQQNSISIRQLSFVISCTSFAMQSRSGEENFVLPIR